MYELILLSVILCTVSIIIVSVCIIIAVSSQQTLSEAIINYRIISKKSKYRYTADGCIPEHIITIKNVSNKTISISGSVKFYYCDKFFTRELLTSGGVKALVLERGKTGALSAVCRSAPHNRDEQNWRCEAEFVSI